MSKYCFDVCRHWKASKGYLSFLSYCRNFSTSANSKSILLGRTARVTFNYVAEQDDELSLETGDIIKNITDVDDGWCQGELNGKIGVFPNNFVEEVVTTTADVPATDSGEVI